MWEDRIKRFIFILLFLSQILFGQVKDEEEEEDFVWLTDSRLVVNRLLTQTTDQLDYVLSIGCEEVKRKKESYIDLKLGGFYEKLYGYSYAYGISMHLDLPNTRHRFKLFVSSIYDDEKDKTRSLTNKREEDKIVLGINYSKVLLNHLTYGMGSGITFNEYVPDPFVRVNFKLTYEIIDDLEFSIGNYLYYFLYYQFDNNAILSFIYKFNSRTYLKFYNSYRYIQGIPKNEIKNIIRFDSFIAPNMSISYIFEISRLKEENYLFRELNYYYAGVNFKHIFHKDWLYYEVAYGFYSRRKHDFRVTPKIMFYLGIIYKAE